MTSSPPAKTRTGYNEARDALSWRSCGLDKTFVERLCDELCVVPAQKRRLYNDLHPELTSILENKYPVGEGQLDSFCLRRSFELVVGCTAVTIVGGLALYSVSLHFSAYSWIRPLLFSG